MKLPMFTCRLLSWFVAPNNKYDLRFKFAVRGIFRTQTFTVQGASTVWHYYPSGRRCPTWQESIFAEWAKSIEFGGSKRLRIDPETESMR